MKKRITLVNGVFRTKKIAYPINVVYLKSYLKRFGYDVEVKDYQLVEKDKFNPKVFVNFLKNSSGILGISVLSSFLPFLILSFNIERDFFLEKKIILGGIGTFGIEKELLKKFSYIDYIIQGEGEEKLRLLLDAICNNNSNGIRKINGVFSRNGSEVILGKGYMPSLRKEFGLFKKNNIILNNEEYNTFNVQFSRGCPFNCNFCGMTSFWGVNHRCRDINSAIEEIEILNKFYGIKKIGIVDNIFTLNTEVLNKFCDRLIDLKIDVQWGCYSRIDTISPKDMEKMSKAGCEKIFFGIESGSDYVLDRINKKLSTSIITKKIKESINNFKIVTTSFIWGFPYETLDDLKETTSLLMFFSYLGTSPKLSLFTPYPYSNTTKKYIDFLKFNKELSTELLYYLTDQEVIDDIIDIIIANKELCTAFYYIDHDLILEKYEFLESINLGNNFFFEAWERASPEAIEINI